MVRSQVTERVGRLGVRGSSELTGVERRRVACYIEDFTVEVQARLATFLIMCVRVVEQMDREIELVAEMLVDTVKCLLPLVHSKRPTQ